MKTTISIPTNTKLNAKTESLRLGNFNTRYIDTTVESFYYQFDGIDLEGKKRGIVRIYAYIIGTWILWYIASINFLPTIIFA